MLEINDLRVERGGNPERMRESQRRRFAKVELVDEVIELDKEWVKCKSMDCFYYDEIVSISYLVLINK